MSAFTVRVWCRDCTGQDDMGCFDGGSDLLHDRKHPFTLREFATLEEAKTAGWEETEDCGPWEFDVERDGVPVFSSAGQLPPEPPASDPRPDPRTHPEHWTE